jgi:hypothetical protein
MKRLLLPSLIVLALAAGWSFAAEVTDLSTTDALNTNSTFGLEDTTAPSAVADRYQAYQGAIARYIADQASGLTVHTSSTNTAYTVSANNTTNTLIDGWLMVLEITSANGISPKLEVNNTGLKNLEFDPGSTLQAGAIESGTRILISYDEANGVWLVLAGANQPTAAAGYSDPLTTRGDTVNYTSGTGRLALGATGTALISNGLDAVWADVASPAISTDLIGSYALVTAAVGDNFMIEASNGVISRAQVSSVVDLVSENFYKAVSEAFTDVKVSVTSTSYTATSHLLAADNDSGDTVELRFSSYVGICRVGGSQTAKYGNLGLYRGTVASGTLIFESSVGRIHAASSSSTCGYYPMNFIYVDDSGSTGANQHYQIGIKSSVATNIRIEEPTNYPATNEEAVFQAFTRN